MGKEDFDDLEKKDNQDIESTQEENKDNKENKEHKQPTDEELEELMEKMQKLVEEASENYGVDPDKIKVMAIPTPKITFISVLVSCLVILVFDFVLLIAFSGVFDWVIWEKKIDLIFYALIFSGIEILLKIASLPLFKIKKNNIVLFSVIKVIPFIITSIICGIWPLFIKIESYYLYILICLLIYAVRKFYTTYFLEKQMKKLMMKHSKNMIKKKENKDKKD